jgi:hypothetical protein
MKSFPLANKEDKNLGWTLNYRFLESIADDIPNNGCQCGMEEVESVLLALSEWKGDEFPEATEEQKKSGWKINCGFLKEISETVCNKDPDNWNIEWEDIEVILHTMEAVLEDWVEE